MSEVINIVVAIFLLLPKGQVLFKKLNDALSVTEVVLLKLVNLVQSILEGLVSKFASSLVIFHDFVVEDREIKSKTKLDGVAWRKGNLIGLFVSFKSLLLDLFHKGTLCILSDVAVVVTNHLYEEGFRFTVTWLAKDFLGNHVDDGLAVSSKLGFNGGLVGSESISVFGVLRVLLNGGNSAASGTLGADQVFEGNREEVAFITGDFGAL